MYRRVSFPFPFHLLPCLTSLTLSKVEFNEEGQVNDLMSLPALRRLDLRSCKLSCPEQELQSQDRANERRIELLRFARVY